MNDYMLSEYIGCIGIDSSRRCAREKRKIEIVAREHNAFSGVISNNVKIDLQTVFASTKFEQNEYHHIQVKEVAAAYIPQVEVTEYISNLECPNEGIFITGVKLLSFSMSDFKRFSTEGNIFVGALINGQSYYTSEEQQRFERVSFQGFELKDECEKKSKGIKSLLRKSTPEAFEKMIMDATKQLPFIYFQNKTFPLNK